MNTPRDDASRGGTICFDFEGAPAVSAELVRRRFFHDYRPRCGLRVSPHFYTTDEELAAFVEALDDVRRHPPASPARVRHTEVDERVRTACVPPDPRRSPRRTKSSARTCARSYGAAHRRLDMGGRALRAAARVRRVARTTRAQLAHWFNSRFSAGAVTVLFVPRNRAHRATRRPWGAGSCVRVHANGLLDLRAGPRAVRWDEVSR